MAKVLWSESSRQDAHNLDDLYERWRLRREEMSEQEQSEDLDRYSDILVQSVNADAIADLDTCELIRSNLLESSNYLQGRIVEAKRSLSSKVSGNGEWHLKTQISELKHLTFKIGLEVGKVNARRKELNLALTASTDRAYIGFLRASMVGILASASDDEDFNYVSAINQVLNHSFRIGDAALFRENKEKGAA